MRRSHVEARLEQQIILSKMIASSYDEIIKTGFSNITSTRVQSRIATLKEDWEKFSLVNDAVCIAIKELSIEDQILVQQHSFLQENTFATTKEAFLNSLEKMTSLLENEITTSDNSTSGQTTLQVSATVPCVYQSRLPRIDLPKFSGTPSEWLPFKDLFNALMTANPTLSAIEELQYLKTSITGSAAHLLSNTTLTADNFQKAWEGLIAFYENKRLLVNAALHSLLSLKRMSSESATEMEQLYVKVIQIYRTLETLNRPVAFWDDFLIFIVLKKMDSESIKIWEQHLGASRDPPKWQQFSEFMVTRFLTLQAYERSRAGKANVKPQTKTVKVHHQIKSNEIKREKTYKCAICSGQHYTALCSQYQEKPVKRKLELIQKHKLCYNCLGTHKISICRVTRRCQKCGRKHHTTIHQAPTRLTTTKSDDNTTRDIVGSASQPTPAVSHSATVLEPSSHTLLATALIFVTDFKGSHIAARALIDQGSEISLISERLVQTLRANRRQSNIPLIGIGAETSTKTKGVVDLTIKPHFKSSFGLTISAHVLPKLTTLIPSHSIENVNWQHLDGLILADPHFATSGSIDILLGADVYGIIIREGLIKGSVNVPIAQNTVLGWIVSGSIPSNTRSNRILLHQTSNNEDLLHLLQRFWELDSITTVQDHTLSSEDQQCENHFKITHSRDQEGRYVVRLPFKSHPSTLGKSKPQASRMLTRLIDKSKVDPTFAKLYSNFMMEYANLGHMKLVPQSLPEPSHVYYLPHHGVLKESSLTTKLRVVFNGSSKTTTGISLNDILLTGPKLQSDLFDVLIWFRQFNYVFTANMEKMYRQVKIHSDDGKFQRILWKDAEGNILTYELQTVTYGLSCAPYLALRAIIQLIEDEGSKFPLAIPTLTAGRYVDDLFGGADTIEDAIVLAQEVNKLCMAGGFPLQKWASNHSSIVHSITAFNAHQSTSISIEDYSVVPSLGLSWELHEDSFEFSFSYTSFEATTKRQVLSAIVKLFDPLGLISPIIIKTKILMQELWTLRLGWDEPLPSAISTKWITFLRNLQDLSLLKFPRWIGYKAGNQVEIHGFSDASPQAIAAVVYTRWYSPAGEIFVRLICSKTKVAPLKRQTIPRLELAGAVLLTKVVKRLKQTLKIIESEIVLWTDSQVTLTWINNHPSRWKEFVHNRVCYVQETLPQAKWKFVAGCDNPADFATRGLTPKQLKENEMWWNGPSWLSKTSSEWPNELQRLSETSILEERKPLLVNVKAKPTVYWDLLDRYSNLNRLLRITVWCHRAVNCFRHRASLRRSDPITTTDLHTAKMFWVKTIQSKIFQSEFKIIEKRGSLPASHPLARLTPFVDSSGILRVGGRLQASSLPQDAKHPAILPRESSFTQLIISDAHIRSYHGGTQLTLCFIREEFWILGGRAPVRKFILHCVWCARHRQIRAKQLMGQLPKERVTPSRPFLNSGVDYAGPFSVKTWKGKNARTYKAYIVLFVCLATSAVHIELVTDYTAEAFIAAYKRFTGRRGICSMLFSDCGTNLKGADTEMKKLLSSATAESAHLAQLLARDGTQWKFIPPSAPHVGGIWEARVKSVKFHLKRIVGDTLLTYEEFSTLLTQIEAILNSRPLTSCTNDPEDLNVLTPGHFIMGCPPTTISEPSTDTIKMSHLSRWQLIRQMTERFWTRWSKECLQRYQAIYKWTESTQPIREGSIVLVSDERYPPTKWPLGLVLKIHPGKDGKTRVVTVRTQVFTLTRPIVKLCPFPITDHTP